MKKFFLLINILPISLMILCSGCQTPYHKLYEGEKLPASEVAVLKNSDAFTRNVDIIEIDNIPGEQYPFGERYFNNHFNGTYHIELLPGKHLLKVQYGTITWRRQGITNLEFEAKPGKIYTIKDKLEKTDKGLFPNKVDLWVEEVGDNPEIKK